MPRLNEFKSYTKSQGMELGKVLRSKNRKKKLRDWITHMGADATKQLPDEWQKLLKNPRQEVRRFWMKKVLGKQVRRAKVVHAKATSAKAVSENHNATK